MIRFSLLFFLFLLLACQQPEDKLTAQAIVDRAIDTACSENCDLATIDFTFRNRCYISRRNGGLYQMERITHDSTGVTRDVLTNDGFERYHNDLPVQLPDSMAAKYANSVNSVHYFAQLPFGLNAPAVRKQLLGETTVNGIGYYEIEVRFDQEGGGKDFDDVFVYWVRKDNFEVDYLAYRYATDGGGIRFREAYNPRIIKGIRFVDYRNYKPQSLNVKLRDLDSLHQLGALKLLSKIETEAVGVELKAAL